MTDIDVLLEILELKDEKRTGWELRGVEAPESVAAHSWGTAFLAFLFADEAGVDRGRAVQMAAVHDVAEAETGDVVFRADLEKDRQEWTGEEKAEAEERAMDRISESLDSGGLRELWQEYEERETVEARFVKDMDMIDMCLQALFYEEDQRYDPDEENEAFDEYEHMDEFFATTEARLSTETGEKLFDEIKERYEDVRQ